MKILASFVKIFTVVFLAVFPVILNAQTPDIIGSYANRQIANNANLSGNYVSSVSDVSANANVILLGDIFVAPDHYPLYELQQRGCKVIRLEGRDQDDFIARIKAYNDYIQSGKNVFADIAEGMGNVTQPVLFPILKSIELKQPNKQNTNLDFVPKPLFNTPPPAEPEYIPPSLAVIAQNGRIALNIDFAPYSAVIPANAQPMLSELASMLKTNPEMKILVEGHTARDNSVDNGYHLNLSVNRARSVKTWLVSSGVDGARIRTVGYGKSRPIADNGTDEGRARNRRIEIVKD
ncbi:MAG: OmpA family protein [Candidatus Riflebacteria bacterium]|nr:OmpA family protein [Candidatus Riflebacteria bacterium]